MDFDDDQPKQQAARQGRRAGRRANYEEQDPDLAAGNQEPQSGVQNAFGSRPTSAAVGGGPDGGPGTSNSGRAGGEEEPGAPRRGNFGMDGDDDEDSALAPPTGSGGGAAAAPPRGAADPLADDGGRRYAGVSRRKQGQQAQEEEEKVKAKSKYDERAQNADIMDIPELEEEGKEDLTRVVAEAPKVRSNKVQGMLELEEEGQFKLPQQEDREIDLSLLTAVLCSAEQVAERDEVWEPDMLFTQVASELNSEKEQGAKPEDGVEEPFGMTSLGT